MRLLGGIGGTSKLLPGRPSLWGGDQDPPLRPGKRKRPSPTREDFGSFPARERGALKSDLWKKVSNLLIARVFTVSLRFC